MLFGLGFLEVAIFEGALVRAEPGVSRSKVSHKTLRQVVKLQLVVIHAVHELPILRVRILLPHLLALAGLAIHEEHRFVPSPLNLISYLIL